MINLKMEKKLPGLCGPCCLKYVLNYYGIEKSQEEIARFSKASKENGSDPWDLLHASFIFGLKGEYIVGCSMKKLKEFVSQKIPVIVDYRRKWGGQYSVVVGFENGKIFLADPYIAEVISIDEKEFEKNWFEEYSFNGKNVKIFGEAIAIWN